EYDLVGGDEVLRTLARILTGTLREVDSVGRVGGEEFLIIARETNADGARRLAERIRATVANTPIDCRGRQVRITVSLGFAVAGAAAPADYEAMYATAARALTEAKGSGRNCFTVYDLKHED